MNPTRQVWIGLLFLASCSADRPDETQVTQLPLSQRSAADEQFLADARALQFGEEGELSPRQEAQNAQLVDRMLARSSRLEVLRTLRALAPLPELSDRHFYYIMQRAAKGGGAEVGAELMDILSRAHEFGLMFGQDADAVQEMVVYALAATSDADRQTKLLAIEAAPAVHRRAQRAARVMRTLP